jgi:hypothetical protein
MTKPLKYPNISFAREHGVTLEKHFESLLDNCQKNCVDKFTSMNKAVDTAKESMEKRLDGMNEFRDTLKDQASRFVTRTELLAAVVGISTVVSIVVSILMKVMK